MICRSCGEKEKIYKKGFSNNNQKQRWRCFNCGKQWSTGIIVNDEVDYIKKNNSTKFESKGNTAIGTANISDAPIDVDKILELFNIDSKMWQVEKFTTNSNTKTNRHGNKYTDHQIKVWFRRNKEVFNYEVIKKDFIEATKNYVPKYKKIDYEFKNQSENNLLEINIADLHLGKLCWEGETGENYDVKIAQERFFNVLKKMIHRVSVFDYNRIVFPIGNDFFNSDNLFNTTTHGTPQDEDLRWQKTYKIGRELLVNAIDFLSQYAPVDVIVVQGNHDFQRMFFVGDALSLWYSNSKDVNINNSAKIRKYYKYGDVLLGFTHGSDEKVANLPLIMAQEATKEWGNTKFKEMHVGHLHHRKEIKYLSTAEYNGIVVRFMRSLAGTDQWHSKKGYVGGIKGGECFLWNANDGLIAMFEVNINN